MGLSLLGRNSCEDIVGSVPSRLYISWPFNSGARRGGDKDEATHTEIHPQTLPDMACTTLIGSMSRRGVSTLVNPPGLFACHEPTLRPGFPEIKPDRESEQAVSTKKEVIEEIKLATSLYQVRVRPASPYEASWLTAVCGEEDG